MAQSNTLDFVDRFLSEAAEIASLTSRQQLENVIDLLWNVYEKNGTIYTCGNGGSAANASHLACDLAKFTWAQNKKRFKAQCLCDNAALISALTNDVGFHRIFVEQLEPVVSENDALICISVHGGSGADKAGPWSQNLLAAAQLVQQRKGKVVALVGYDGGALKQIADAYVLVPRSNNGFTSTPHVEGWHVVYHHLICERLRQMVDES